MTDKANTKGREANSAQGLGLRDSADTPERVKTTGKREAQSAGPDGPDATVVGDTFKKQPKK